LEGERWKKRKQRDIVPKCDTFERRKMKKRYLGSRYG
jgi:hypothetical protein